MEQRKASGFEPIGSPHGVTVGDAHASGGTGRDVGRGVHGFGKEQRGGEAGTIMGGA